jgi:hypothetical protein
MTDGNGNCRPLGPAAGDAGGGVKMGCVLECAEALGNVARADAVAAMESDGVTVVAPLSSKRRSSPRSNPANFDFTVFGMVNCAVPVFYNETRRFRYSRNPATDGVIDLHRGVRVAMELKLSTICPVVLFSLIKRYRRQDRDCCENHCESCFWLLTC